MESDYAEANLSTEQPAPREKARLQGKDGDEERPRSSEAASSEGPQTPDRPALLGSRLTKETRLAKRAEFLRVYEQGSRIDGHFMTVFFMPNGRDIHRVGVTATKKAIGKAHDRNRAKRLLREAFRLSRAEMEPILERYDWVLNARRGILNVKLERPLEEFRQMVRKVASGTKESK